MMGARAQSAAPRRPTPNTDNMAPGPAPAMRPATASSGRSQNSGLSNGLAMMRSSQGNPFVFNNAGPGRAFTPETVGAHKPPVVSKKEKPPTPKVGEDSIVERPRANSVPPMSHRAQSAASTRPNAPPAAEHVAQMQRRVQSASSTRPQSVSHDPHALEVSQINAGSTRRSGTPGPSVTTDLAKTLEPFKARTRARSAQSPLLTEEKGNTLLDCTFNHMRGPFSNYRSAYPRRETPPTYVHPADMYATESVVQQQEPLRVLAQTKQRAQSAMSTASSVKSYSTDGKSLSEKRRPELSNAHELREFLRNTSICYGSEKKSHCATPEQKENFINPQHMQNNTVFKPEEITFDGKKRPKVAKFLRPKKEQFRYDHIHGGGQAKVRPGGYEFFIPPEERIKYPSNLHEKAYCSVLQQRDYRVESASKHPKAKQYTSHELFKFDMTKHSRYHDAPARRFEGPQTSAMEIGWKKPIRAAGPIHGRSSTFITQYADSMILGPRHP